MSMLAHLDRAIRQIEITDALSDLQALHRRGYLTDDEFTLRYALVAAR